MGIPDPRAGWPWGPLVAGWPTRALRASRALRAGVPLRPGGTGVALRPDRAYRAGVALRSFDLDLVRENGLRKKVVGREWEQIAGLGLARHLYSSYCARIQCIPRRRRDLGGDRVYRSLADRREPEHADG